MKIFGYLSGLTLFILIIPTVIYSQTLDLEFSTYLGGTMADSAFGISVSSSGIVYIAGVTGASDFPTVNPCQASCAGNFDAFVSAFSSGTELLFSTYLGGSGNDFDLDYGIAVGSSGNVYITGGTDSPDFPTLNPYQAGYGGGTHDAFLSGFSSAGDILFSTYMGGSNLEHGAGVAVGSSGDAFITGDTGSDDFPTINSYQASKAGPINVFISRFSSGGLLLSSTYFGGSGYDMGGFGLGDYGQAIAVGESGIIYITGDTCSGDFPTLNPYQGSLGNPADGTFDAFLSAFSSETELLYSTYLGGDDEDSGFGVSAGPGGRISITGETDSSDFPTVNPYQPSSAGNYDAFVSVFSSGTELLFSTYLGGADDYEGARSISFGSSGGIYIAGETFSSDFPTLNPYQSSLGGGGDGFVSGFSSENQLLFSTYLGGSSLDRGMGISVCDGAIYVSGDSDSLNFPTRDCYQASNSSGLPDAFVSKLRFSTPAPSPTPVYNIIQSGDYDGDGVSDIAIFRETTGLWAVRGLGRLYFGGSGDVPVSGDYNGDGITDVAIFRQPGGLWAIKDITRLYFGACADRPVPGDYDGDRCCDPSVFNGTTGRWRIRDITLAYFGAFGDYPVPVDYSGDGTTDIGIFRPSNGLWAIRTLSRSYFGADGDRPVPGIYQWYGSLGGSGPFQNQIAVFRPSTGLWAIKGFTRYYFGRSGDIPVPADFDGDSLDGVAIFRSDSGLWALRSLSRLYFGGPEDLSVTR